jgi:hypothetical protein
VRKAPRSSSRPRPKTKKTRSMRSRIWLIM